MIEIKKLHAVFQTLADHNRLTIIRAVCDKECSVGELVNVTNLSQPLVSHHLRVLKENDFLITKRKGPFIFYSIRDEKILFAINMFLELFKDSTVTNESSGFCPGRIMKKYC